MGFLLPQALLTEKKLLYYIDANINDLCVCVCVQVKHAMMQLYVLKLLKMQTKYLGRQWRKTNMKTMSAIYQKVSPPPYQPATPLSQPPPHHTNTTLNTDTILKTVSPKLFFPSCLSNCDTSHSAPKVLWCCIVVQIYMPITNHNTQPRPSVITCYPRLLAITSISS